MIYEETVPIWLDPKQPLLHSVSVPAKLANLRAYALSSMTRPS